MLPGNAANLGARLIGIVGEAKQLADLIQGEAEIVAPPDEVQSREMLSCVGAIIAAGTGGGRQQADPLVIPDGFDFGASWARQFADAESFFHSA